MAMGKLTLILFAFTLFNNAVDGKSKKARYFKTLKKIILKKFLIDKKMNQKN